MAAQDEHKLKRLHYAAAELPGALVNANQELPSEFPDEALRQIAANLRALEDTTTEAERQVLVHARSTLRNARRMLQGDPGDPETILERALKDIIVEIDELLDEVPPRELIALRPEDGPGPVVRRSDLEGKVAALGQRIEAMEAAGRQSITQIQQYGLFNIGSIQLALDALIKVAGEFKAEIASKLIDLGWLTHFVEQVKSLSDALGKGTAAIKRATGELVNFVRGLQRVRRLGNRVFQGGRALVHAVNRRIQKLSCFRDIDAPWCPELVVVQPGKFVMGSPKDEDGRDVDEGPQHEVTIAQRLAVGRYPVTFEEYDRFIATTRRERHDDAGRSRGKQPVINVSWEDAQTYVVWLGKETGQPYHLLSEAEWEYAARAGTTTRYSWGNDDPTPEQANFGREVGKTTEVGTYPPNPWGLYDMHGNVWEWVEDCWNESYAGAPSDGNAWTSGDCSRRVLRGGSWGNSPGGLRSACRGGGSSDLRNYYGGFRVARTLR